MPGRSSDPFVKVPDEERSVYGVWKHAQAGFSCHDRGLFFSVEEAKVCTGTDGIDLSLPLSAVLMPGDPAVLRRCPPSTWAVLNLYALRDNSQVRSPIVQAVSIDVVAFDPVSGNEAKNQSVHGSFRPCSVTTSQIPPSFSDAVCIGSINNGVSDSFAYAVDEGNVRRVPVVAHDDRERGLPRLATAAAVVAFTDLRRRAGNRRVARQASKMYGHRILQRFGVVPPACYRRTRGLRRVNYSSSLRVEAA